MIIMGGLEDQLSFLVWSKISEPFFRLPEIYADFYRGTFFNFTHPWRSNQPISAFFFSIIGTIFRSYSLVFVTLFGFALTFYFTYKLFSKFRARFALSLIFTFSSYVLIHLGNHIALFQAWLFPLFLLFLFQLDEHLKSSKHSLLLAVFISVSIGISNYIGFFILIYFLFYSFLRYIFDKDSSYIKNLIFVGVITALLSSVFLYPYFKANYSDDFAEIANREERERMVLTRSYEDFFTFSSRPWYFFLPPKQNPWLGNITGVLTEKIESTNYFLANDYFAAEHSANYFGLFFLTSVVITSVMIFSEGPSKERKEIVFFWILNFLLYFTMLPPFFTIFGLKIYTPGELVYRFFPMFRTTVRMAPLMLLNFLIILGISIEHLSKKFPIFFSLFIPVLALITCFETYIPPKITYHTQPPEVYSFLGKNAPQEKFIYYPNNKRQRRNSLFWLDVHNVYWMNKKVCDSIDNGSNLCDNLATDEGISGIRDIGIKYLVVTTDSISTEDLDFFLSQEYLTLVEEFPEDILLIVE